MKAVEAHKAIYVQISDRSYPLLVCSVSIGGALLGVSFPRFDLLPLAWVALVPLLLAIEGADRRRSFLLGWAFGFAYFLVTLYWLSLTMSNYGGMAAPMSILVMLLLVAYLGLYVGLFAFLTSYLAEGGAALKWVAVPFIWVGVEYLRGRLLFGGFPWASIAYSQYKWSSFIQVSDITGIYGPAFIIVMANSAIAFFLRTLWGKGSNLEREHTFRGAAIYLSVTAILFASALIYGSWQLSAAKYPGENPRKLKIALLQGNIDQAVKWNPSYQRETISIYGEMTDKVAQLKPDLIIWPETAAPFFFEEGTGLSNEIAGITRRASTYLLFGSPSIKREADGNELFNSAYLLSPDGKSIGRYDKIHLVPFGEYIPLKRMFFFATNFVKEVGEFESGSSRTIMDAGGNKFSALICFEVIFPGLVRQFVNNGARFLVNITNDAWFGKTSAPYQHISMAAFRAVENRVPIVRAANTGISAFIDQYGRIIDPGELFTRQELIKEVAFDGAGQTFYSRYGDIFFYIALSISGILFVLKFLNRGSER